MSISITTVFTNNRSQAVRLPSEDPLPDHVKRVAECSRGGERIITPIENTWDNFFLNGLMVSDDFMVDRGEQKPVERESL